MKILIIENEVYLAQSIATKLGELGHTCETCTSAREATKSNDFDVVLLSTSISSNDITPIIEFFDESIIILMVTYISNDTVSKPLKAGAKDYILKPFMIEELIRKIDHHKEYELLKHKVATIEKYLESELKIKPNEYNFEQINFPVFIYSSIQKNADSFAYNFAKYLETMFTYININDSYSFSEIKNATKNTLLYIVNYQNLKKSDKQEFLELIKDKKAIIASFEPIDDIDNVLEINNEKSALTHGEILPIEDYVKFIVLNYQHKYPDTELSKKLGISRKSLWEKRKKYDIIKKK